MAIDFYLSIDHAYDQQAGNNAGQQQIQSFSIGATNTLKTDPSTETSSGQFNISDLNLTLADETLTPSLFKSAFTGRKHTYYLTGVTGGASPQVVEQFQFISGTLSSFYETYDGGDLPTDQLSINFRAIKTQFFPQNVSRLVTNEATTSFNAIESAAVAANEGGSSAPPSPGWESIAESDRNGSTTFDHVFQNAGGPSSNFTFTSGHGNDLISQFRARGVDHDTMSFLGSDFGNDIADVLRHTRSVGDGVVITDPTSNDTVTVTGVNKGQLVHNQGDITFHG